MRKIGLKLIVIVLFFNSFVQAQNISYLDSYGNIKYIEGLTGEKNKIKNGKKQGRIEQVVLRKEIKFLDEYKYIPDVEKSFIDTSISIKNIIKQENNFLVFVGNYVDGIKQGEFKLYDFRKNFVPVGINQNRGDFCLLASVNYLNDTIDGNFIFNGGYFYGGRKFKDEKYITVLMSKNKIKDQVIKTDDIFDFIIFKESRLDSGHLGGRRGYNFKKINTSRNLVLTISDVKFDMNGALINDNSFVEKTILRIDDGDKFLERDATDYSLWKDFSWDNLSKNLKTEGIRITADRNIKFSINNNKFNGFINCYYKNDSLNYSINTENGFVNIWVDLNIDKKIKIFNGENSYLKPYSLIFGNGYEDLFSSKSTEDVELPKTGYFKIAEMKEISFKNNYDNSASSYWYINKPINIDYKVGNVVFRNESWEKNTWGNYLKQYTNFDQNGNILSSSNIDKNKEAIKRKKDEQDLLKAFGVKDDNEVVSCAYCKQKLVKKNGETIRSVQCSSTSIPCMNAKGLPCEWTFCNMKCSNDFQCAQCAQYKSYRANCR